MTREEAIKALRTESIELGGPAPSVCRFWEALETWQSPPSSSHAERRMTMPSVERPIFRALSAIQVGATIGKKVLTDEYKL